MAESPQGQGIVARVTAALRYAVTGAMPDGWFGPLTPLPPQAPEDVRGRQFDYPVGINLNYRPRSGEPLGFDALKKLASYPVVAMLIRRQKDKVASIDWQVKPRIEENPDKAEDPEIGVITDFLRYPDREHDWGQWIGGVIDQLLVIDAVSIYGAPTRSGGLYALQALDGAQFKPILDFGGRRPLPPEPAFQQIIKGLPAINYTSDELIYFPETYRPDKVYGFSRLEAARDLIEMAISRLKSQKGYFDYGNIGDGYFSAPSGWTPTQILDLETKWNSWMSGDPSLRRLAPMVPDGTKWNPTKVDLLSDAFDEFLIRLLCFPFGVAPQPFMKQTGMGHGSAGTEHEAAEEGGVLPLMQYVERLISMIIAKWFGRPDLEFSFVDDREFDPKVAADIDDIRLKNGSRTINEVRDRNGEKPIPNGDVPLIYGSAVTRLEDAVAEPAPPPTIVAPGAEPGAAPPDASGGLSGGDKSAAKLAKAANAAAQKRLAVLLGAYLAAKGDALASALADKLVKTDPSMEEHSHRLDEAFSEVDWDWRDLPPIVEPVLAGVAVAAGTDAASALGLFDAETLKRVSARATAYAQDRAAEMVGMKWVGGELVPNPSEEWTIDGATRDMLRTSVTQAMDEGQSNDQLAKVIRENAAFSPERSETIARTETAVADIRGSAAGWIESGVVSSAQFVASPDCCDECQAEDGTIVELTSPDDLDLPHPNCRCGWIAIVDSADTTDSEDQGD